MNERTPLYMVEPEVLAAIERIAQVFALEPDELRVGEGSSVATEFSLAG